VLVEVGLRRVIYWLKVIMQRLRRALDMLLRFNPFNH